jgi:hypothetical protein
MSVVIVGFESVKWWENAGLWSMDSLLEKARRQQVKMGAEESVEAWNLLDPPDTSLKILQWDE